MKKLRLFISSNRRFPEFLYKKWKTFETGSNVVSIFEHQFTILLTMRPARQPVSNWTQLAPEHFRCTLLEAVADLSYQALSTFRAQCVHLTALPAITPYYAGRLLGVDPKGVRRQVEKAYGPRRPPDKPPVLNDEQVTAVTAFIRQRWELRDPASVCDVVNFIWEQFAISVIPDTLSHTRSDFRIARWRTTDSRPALGTLMAMLVSSLRPLSVSLVG